MASAKPPEKVIPVTHAKPWLEEKLRHVELKLAAVEDFEKISIEEGFRERMLVLAKHRDEYTKQLETLNQEFSDLFRDYAGFENPPVLESHPVLEKINKSLWIPVNPCPQICQIAVPRTLPRHAQSACASHKR